MIAGLLTWVAVSPWVRAARRYGAIVLAILLHLLALRLASRLAERLEAMERPHQAHD